MVREKNHSTEKIWKILEEIPDPEIQVLTITDLGILRDVILHDSAELEILITPTYSGCPAMDVIRMNIRMALAEKGFEKVKLTTVLAPAWTTDWMSEAGKKRLKEFGIAPPNPKQTVCEPNRFREDEAIQCPRCNSWQTRCISEFGSTACKAQYQCMDCHEPFDYFKCH